MMDKHNKHTGREKLLTILTGNIYKVGRIKRSLGFLNSFINSQMLWS